MWTIAVDAITVGLTSRIARSTPQIALEHRTRIVSETYVCHRANRLMYVSVLAALNGRESLLCELS